jgi:hypothetical protein
MYEEIRSIVKGGHNDEAVQESASSLKRVELDSPKSPNKSSAYGKLLLQCHLQSTNETYGKNQDAKLGETVENGDNKPSRLQQLLVLRADAG